MLKVTVVVGLSMLWFPASAFAGIPGAELEAMHLRAPAWEGETVYWESSILLDAEDGQPPRARLARKAAEVLAVRAANRAVDLDPARDVRVDGTGLTLTVSAPHSIPLVGKSELYKEPNAPQSYRHRVGNENQWLLYAPGHWFHDHNIEISYRVAPNQNDPRVVSVQGELPRTRKKLAAGEPLRLAVSGDSISTGLDASHTANAKPDQGGYVELLAAQLEHDFAGKVQVTNRSVAGWSVANGVEDADKLLELDQDLIIIAYGMNDVGRRDPQWFHDRLGELIQKIRTCCPVAEIILVSPMLGNAEWIHTPPEIFPKYRDVMQSFVGPGIALADVTEVWTWMTRHKHFLDLTGNGLNHPNDFGHRLYAQCILQLLPR